MGMKSISMWKIKSSSKVVLVQYIYRLGILHLYNMYDVMLSIIADCINHIMLHHIFTKVSEIYVSPMFI